MHYIIKFYFITLFKKRDGERMSISQYTCKIDKQAIKQRTLTPHTPSRWT